jgi:prolyl oligopeptidase family protein
MRILEERIRRYELMRWSQEPDRRVLPFSWGTEHIGGHASQADPRAFLEHFADETVARSDEWFASTPAPDYALDADDVLTFTSQVESRWPANNRVHAQLFRAARRGPAVVVLAQWNAKWHEQQASCRWLNRLGITAIKMSLPYHDRRAIPGHPRADFLVAPDIGLALEANRQAILDVRRTVRWLEREGYTRIGILGTSVGSCIGFIAMAHDSAVVASAHLHVSTHFGDVVATGLTTKNVWESLRAHVTQDELRRYWLPISPSPYFSKLHGSGKRVLAIAGKYDPTFHPEYTDRFMTAMRSDGVRFESLSLPCGHYSLGAAPFKYAVGYRFGTFLRRALA